MDSEVSNRDLTEVQSQHMPLGTEKCDETLSQKNRSVRDSNYYYFGIIIIIIIMKYESKKKNLICDE
jgi:predicted nucleic acid-binding Zn ribbon protein